MGPWKACSLFVLIIFVFTTHWLIGLVDGKKLHKSSSSSSSSAGNFLNLFQNCLIRLSSSSSGGDRENENGRDESIVARYARYFGQKSTVIIDTIVKSDDDRRGVRDDIIGFKRNGSENGMNDDDDDNDNGKRVVGGGKIVRKNLACFAQIYFVDGIVGDSGDFLWMHKILENVVIQNENPDYIIFIKNKKTHLLSPSFVQGETGFYSNLYRLTLTSKFLVIDGGRRIVQLLCMHCRGQIDHQLKSIDMTQVGSLQDLDELWEKIHANFLGRSVDGFMTKGRAVEEIRKFNQHDCGLYKAGLKTVENICAQLAISKSLNFTPFTTTQDFRVYGHVKSGVMSYSGYNDQLFLKPSSRARYEWATTGEYFEPFIYITVVNKDALNISALWRTFDLQTWMAILSIFMMLASLFAAMSSSRFEQMRSRLAHLRFTFVLFTAILLEQSQLTIWKVKMGINRLSKIIIIVWIIVSIIISSLYKGTIFSYLCTSLPPPIPPTTKALVESPYFLLTSTSYYFQGRAYSTLDGILNEMTVGQAGRDYPLFYKELKENVHFVAAGHAEIVKAHKASSQMLVINNHHHHNYDSTTTTTTREASQEISRELITLKDTSHGREQQYQNNNKKKKMEMEMPLLQNVTLPNNFAVIGSEFDVETLKKLLETFTTSFVLKSSTVHIFLNRLPFIIRRNFFLKKFQPKLAHLYESGIYSRWRKMSEIDTVAQEFQSIHHAIGIGEKQEQNHYNYLALLFSGMKIIESHRTLQPKPLSFEVFDSAFVFYILCSAASITLFLTEWSFYIFAKFFLNVQRNVVGHQKM